MGTLVIGLAMWIGAQQTQFVAPLKPPELKCEKYQHVEAAHYGCDIKGSMGFCDRIITEQCADDIHFVTEREWQELMEKIRWIDHIREAQCPSLSWVGGKCLPFCDEINGTTGSCAYRPKEKL